MASAADEHMHMHGTAASPSDPPILITINPEARLSVVREGALPPPAECGKPVMLSMQILNQGFVTARLDAELIDPPAGVALDFHPEPLTGVKQELRTLGIILTQPGPTDLTVSFKPHNHTPDLGGRDRIHFLIRCIPSTLR